MWNLQNDKELDKLSREAAENYSMDQSPDSWNKVHLQLEAEMPEERRRRYLLFFLLFLFVGSGIFWLTRMDADDVNEQTIAGQKVSSKDESTSSKETRKDPVVTNPTSPVDKSKTQSPTEETTVQTEKKQITPVLTPSSISLPRRSMDARNNKSLNPQANKERTKNKQSDKNDLKKDEVIAEKSLDTKEKNDPIEAKANPLTKNDAVLPPVDDNKNQTDQQPISSTNQNDQAKKQDPTTAAKEKNAKPRMNSRWTIGAVYAPDISTVKFEYTQPLGLNLGMMVEYQLSKKFSLQTGLIYTKKNYKMKGEDYHPPKGYWTDYVKLEDVTGHCIMLDIPINARFNAVRKKSSNIFFSAGLSTYLMKEENYSFYYYYNGMPTTRERTYDANSEYLFNILNVSAGYEKKLSRAFSLQVEPFFKQTLSGVGFGEISLNSAGVYFSLRYNPLTPVKQAATAKK